LTGHVFGKFKLDFPISAGSLFVAAVALAIAGIALAADDSLPLLRSDGMRARPRVAWRYTGAASAVARAVPSRLLAELRS